MRPAVGWRINDGNARTRGFAPPVRDSPRPDFTRDIAAQVSIGEALKQLYGPCEMRFLEA